MTILAGIHQGTMDAPVLSLRYYLEVIWIATGPTYATSVYLMVKMPAFSYCPIRQLEA